MKYLLDVNVLVAWGWSDHVAHEQTAKWIAAAKHAFLPDDRSASRFPEWCRQASRTTDAHLLELAKAHGAILATLDERNPGAFVVPGLRE